MISKRRNENLIYLFIWVIAGVIPIFTLRGEVGFSWDRAVFEWIRIAPFFFIFLLNNRILVPKLLFNEKNIQYLIYLSLSIIAIALLFEYSQHLIEATFIDYTTRPEFLPRPESLPPHEFMPPLDNPGPPHLKEISRNKIGQFLDIVVISFLVVGFNTAIKFVFKREEEEKKVEEQKKIHLQTELSFLRQQISPHFFMNTLNNIHSLIDIDTTQAQSAIIKLSKLMRYLLTESQRGGATIQEEFEFLNSYIDLMRLRCSERVNITVDLDMHAPQRRIPTLLFVSLVENAFKYGVSYSNPSFITIRATVSEKNLIFIVKNSIAPEKKVEPGTGVGLENLRKQLSLLYGTNYTFAIQESKDVYSIQLIIPLPHD